MAILITSMIIGLILALLALGIFISFRVFDFPDITVEGSFTLGAVLGAMLIVRGMNPLLACLIAFAGGMIAGALTGLIHTRFKINPLLSGILVMTALYSVNLHVLGRSNLPMQGALTVFSGLEKLSLGIFGEGGKILLLGWSVDGKDLLILLAALIVVSIICLVLRWFFRTHLGTAMRATGDNSQMIRALGVNTKNMIVFGIALANGFVALSGAMMAQFQGFADVQMGIGMMVWGLASVIIGQAVVGQTSVGYVIFGAVLGSVLFRLLVAIALRLGMNPNDLKIITAAFVFIALILPVLLKRRKGVFKRKEYA
ncbi:MAG TPA: ABC transporter permease [Bacteroidales bacterium]|mgnify:CR=1 FL=1|nr:ABC transporter permease [Bacteroidales bacterium]